MKSISLNITKAASFLAEGAVKAYEPKVKAAQEALENGTCEGNDFLGWLHLPSSITPEFLNEIQAVANTLREKCEVVVVAGIGGSYLGARAVIEGLGNSFAWLVNDKKNPTILFAGNNIGEDYLFELTSFLKNKKFGVINISKSGTTTETALAFRLLKKQCEEQRGKEEAKDVIVAVTDAKKGAARTCADKEGYKSFIIPDNVGPWSGNKLSNLILCLIAKRTSELFSIVTTICHYNTSIFTIITYQAQTAHCLGSHAPDIHKQL